MTFIAKIDKTTLKGSPIILEGTFQEVGNHAPLIKVLTPDLQEKTIGGESNKAQLIIAVPSLDTPVCDAEARRFNQEVAKHANIDTTVVSMDLPFASAKFCNVAGIENLTVGSDFRHKAFARNYGILIANGALEGLCARAIFVISKDAKIVYKQVVPEITEEPNYDEALSAAIDAANRGASCCGFCQ
ncbi:MAG: thiol peroxidase [Sulfurospirillaceae bacterium]|nr:thiol peroxidase [Sulfurospirillaceae bacterium]